VETFYLQKTQMEFHFYDPYEDLVGLKNVVESKEKEGLLETAKDFYSSSLILKEPLSFVVEKRHCNGGGGLHGGMIATFADYAVCTTAMVSANLKKNDGQLYHVVTVNLGIEYVSAGQIDDTIVAEVDVCKETRSLLFCRGVIKAQRQMNDSISEIVIALVNATVKVVKIRSRL